MRLNRSNILLLFITLLLSAVLSMIEAGQSKALPQEGRGRVAVFAVSSSAGELPEAMMEPFVIIEQGQYKKPVAGDSDAAEISRFAAGYYQKGRKYRLLFGGGEAGTATVKASNENDECFRTGAKATLQGQVPKLNLNVIALATDSDSLGRTPGSRRAPTASERASALSLARTAYLQKGVPAALLPTLQTINLTAIDVDKDGKFEIIGSFVVKKTKGGQARYTLFLLAEQQGAKYQTAIANHERITEKEIMSGASINDVNENGIYVEKLVDQLDLDRDGTGEVITMTTGLEGVSYYIYGKTPKGQWRQVYEFGNYRCAF